MGVKDLHDISSERTHQICSSKIHVYSWEGLYHTKVVKRIAKFKILTFLFLFGLLTWQSIANYKMFRYLKNDLPQSEPDKNVCLWGKDLVYVRYFSLLSFQGHFEIIWAFPICSIFDNLVSRKRQVVEKTDQNWGLGGSYLVNMRYF